MTDEQARKRRVVSSHESAYPDPIVVEAGDEIEVSERDTEWDGWLWCTDTTGREGWIPAAYITGRTGLVSCRADYTAAELTVAEGEFVMSHDAVGGWEW